MAFSLQDVGHNAKGPLQAPAFRLRPGPLRLSFRKTRIGRHLFRAKFRMASQEGQNRTLILLRGKGTGGIYHSASGRQHRRRVIQYLALTGGAHLHMLLTPLASGILILAEHPFS